MQEMSAQDDKGKGIWIETGTSRQGSHKERTPVHGPPGHDYIDMELRREEPSWQQVMDPVETDPSMDSTSRSRSRSGFRRSHSTGYHRRTARMSVRAPGPSIRDDIGSPLLAPVPPIAPPTLAAPVAPIPAAPLMSSDFVQWEGMGRHSYHGGYPTRYEDPYTFGGGRASFSYYPADHDPYVYLGPIMEMPTMCTCRASHEVAEARRGEHEARRGELEYRKRVGDLLGTMKAIKKYVSTMYRKYKGH
jgi:hypothetical protein